MIPGGMWGHQAVSRQPPGYPQFFDRADGCRIWDVDAAARAQEAAGDPMNGPSPRLVELAELLVELIPHADWAMFVRS